MALQSSGNSISFQNIIDEFGENDTKSMGEYRVSQTVGALSNQPLDTGIPQSGAIKFSDFYDKRLNVIIDYHTSNANNPADAKSKYAQANDGTTGESEGSWTVIGGFRNPPTNTGGTKTRIHVNKTIGSSKGNATHCAVRTGTGWNSGTVLTVEVGSSGLISGAGGDGGNAGKWTENSTPSVNNGGNGGAGTSGLGIQYGGTSIINNGSIVAGGGGGGGGGARRLEREENWGGPVYRANGGGGGGGQGIPNGAGGALASGGVVETYVDKGVFFNNNSTYNNANSPTAITNGVYRVMGSIASVDSYQNRTDSNRPQGTYTNVSYSVQNSSDGTGATFTIVVNSNGKATATITNSGKGYVVNDTITVNNSQLGNVSGVPNLKFDVASISDEFTFRRSGSTVGTNITGDPLVVGSGVGSKKYERASTTGVTDGVPNAQVDKSPVYQVWRISEQEIETVDASGNAGNSGTNTAGGAGGNGAENGGAHGGGGGGGGNAAAGGEGGNNNDGGNGTTSKGGNGAQGVNTENPENEENVTGQGGTGGSSGAAIRRTSGITVNITNNGTITGSQTATGVTNA